MKMNWSARSVAILALIAFMCSLVSGSTRQVPASEQGRADGWADWVEPDFPFFSSVIDAGRAGPGFPARNLTPRGLVLRIGRDHWVGFDTDLLRVAAIWRGAGITPKALAPGSYHQPDKKTPGGQTALPEPDGKVWLANGIYPGWQTGDRPSFSDPREPAPSPEEVGRGPLPGQTGRFKAVRLVGRGVVLEYTAGGADVSEHVSLSELNGKWTLVRHFRVGASRAPLWLMLGAHADDAGFLAKRLPGFARSIPMNCVRREARVAGVNPEIHCERDDSLPDLDFQCWFGIVRGRVPGSRKSFPKQKPQFVDVLHRNRVHHCL